MSKGSGAVELSDDATGEEGLGRVDETDPKGRFVDLSVERMAIAVGEVPVSGATAVEA